MAGLTFDIRGDNTDFNQKISEVQNQITNTAKIASDQSAAIDALFGRLSSAAAKFGISLSALGLGNRIMQTRGQFQQLEIAFNTMLGSAEKGNALMQQLVQTAAITPFDLKGVAQGAKQLLAYGIAADEVNETITKIGDIAAGLSVPLNDLIYLYGTTMTQGRMFTQDLRQFQGRGVPIADALAKQMGIAKNAVGEAVTAGKVDAQTFKAAIMSLASSGSQFGGLMQEQSKSITGQISNIEDALDVMFNDIGKSQEGLINTGLSWVSSLVENYERVGRVLLVAATAFGTYKASLIATQAIEKLKNNSAIAGLEAEITEVNKEIAARERLNGVIAQQSTKGSSTGNNNQPSQEKSGLQDKLAERQALLQSIKQEEAVEKQAKLNIAATEHNAAQSQLALAKEKQAIAQGTLATAKQEYEVALQQKALADQEAMRADADVYAKEGELNIAKRTGDKGKIGQAEANLYQAQLRKNAANEAQDTATANYNTASRNLNTATDASNIAAKQAEAAATNEQTAAEAMHNAAVEKANALNSLNAGETDKSTIAARKEVVEIEAKTAALEAEIQRKRELLAMDADGGTSSNDTTNPLVADAQSKLSEQAAINAGLDEEFQKRVDIAQQELTSAQENYSQKAAALDLADQENIAAQINLADAQDALGFADEKLKKEQDYLESVKAAVEAGEASNDDVQSAADDVATAKAEQLAAAKDLETASEEANTAEKKLNTAAEELNTAESELNTAQTNLNTASQRQQAASEVQATTAKTANTGATAGNTIAVETNTLATKASALASKAFAGVQAVLTGAITSTKNAFNALKLAFATNPFGAIITGAMTLISLLPLVKDLLGLNENEASESSDRFGEAADKTISKVTTLYEVLNNSSSTSKVYKDSMEELTGICQQYGIQIDKEGNQLDQINEKRKELIALIQEEGAARIYANGVAEAEQDYSKTIDEAQEAMKEGLTGVSESMKGTFASIFTQGIVGNMDALTEAYNKMHALNEQGLGGTSEGRAATQQYIEMVEQSTVAIRNAIIADKERELELQGVTHAEERHRIAQEQTKEAIESVNDVANTQVGNMIRGNNTYRDRVDALNNAKEATSGLVETTSGLVGENKRLATQSYLANLEMDDLKNACQNVLKQYNNNHLDWQISLSLDNTQVPAWMKEQLGLNKKGGPTQKDVQKGKNRAAFWTSVAKTVNGKNLDGYTVSGHKFTAKEINQKARESTAGAALTEETYTKNKAQEESTKKEREEKAKAAAKKAAQEAKKAATEQQKYNKILKETEINSKEQDEKDARNTYYSVEQAAIDGMNEGNAKKLRQLELNYKKERDQIDQQEADALKQAQNEAKKLYEANPKNKGKIFEDSAEYKNTTNSDTQKRGFDAQRQSAEIKYNKSVEDARKSELESMREYLKEFGTIKQKRDALIDGWNEKIAGAQNEGERLTFVQQRAQAVRDFDNEQVKNNTDWEQLFGDVGTKSVSQLKNTKADLKAKLDNGDLSVKDYQAIVEQIDRINDALVDAQTNQSIFGSWVTEYGKERKKIEMEIAEAMERQVEARAQLQRAELEKDSAQLSVESLMEKYGVSTGKGMGKAEVSDAQSAISKASSKFGAGSVQVKALQSAFDRLALSSKKVTSAQDKLATATDKAKKANEKKDNREEKENFYTKNKETFDNISANVSSAQQLGQMIGGDAGSSLSTAAEGVNSGINAVKDFYSGNYVGAAMNAVSAVDSFSNALGITGDSDKTLASDIEKLTAQNQALQYAIENLTDEIKDSSFTGAVSAYKQQIEYLDQTAKNTQEMMYRSGDASKSGIISSEHSSFYTVNDGMRDGQSWNRISQVAGVSVKSAQDFFSLTSEQMAKVAKYAPELYAKIKNLADDGYKDAAQYMDEYITYGEQAVELADQLNEKLTTITFDSLKDDLASTLADLDASFSDLANSMEGYFRDAIVQALLSSEGVQDKLEAWYKEYAKRMEDGVMSEADREYLTNDFNSIAEDIWTQRNTLLEAAGLDSSSSSQSASGNSATDITQDQAEEISGRMTALQYSAEVRNEMISQAVAQIVTLSQTHISLTTAGNQTLSDILTQAALANGFLEDITKYNKMMYESWELKLEEMRKKIAIM